MKFKDRSTRNSFYKARKVIRNSYPNVYINEHLTEKRSALFYGARKLIKGGQIESSWTQNGNVMVRRNKDVGPIQIKKYGQISDMIQEEREAEMYSDDDTIEMDPDTFSIESVSTEY